MNIPNLRKKLLTRRAVFVALLALVLCALAALIAFCLPRAVNPTIPPAPITRAPSVTPSPFEVTRVLTNTPASPTVSVTPTNAPTQTPTLTPTLQTTDMPTMTATATPTNIPTIPAGRNGTMPTTGAAQDSGAFWTILGVVLLALGFWIYDAASKDNPTW